MKIALCSSYVPFVHGGYRNIVDWLEESLKQAGHQVEKIYLPQVDHPDLLVKQCFVYRWVDLSAADRIICFRPFSYLIPHPHKILWFIHHLRSFYDLWDNSYRGFSENEKYNSLRKTIHTMDSAAFQEAKMIFTNSQIVSNRLLHYNKIHSEALYPPIYQPERFSCHSFNDEIVYISRIESHKRQHLLIEALKLTRSPVKLRIAGMSMTESYINQLRSEIVRMNLQERIFLEHRWISESEKVTLLANCLAAAYLPVDEDSYGYPSLEASLSSKPVLTTTDSGGVMELIIDGTNGYAVEPDPQAVAEAMDKLFLDRENTRRMGENAKARLQELNISWDHVLNRFLA